MASVDVMTDGGRRGGCSSRLVGEFFVRRVYRTEDPVANSSLGWTVRLLVRQGGPGTEAAAVDGHSATSGCECQTLGSRRLPFNYFPPRGPKQSFCIVVNTYFLFSNYGSIVQRYLFRLEYVTSHEKRYISNVCEFRPPSRYGANRKIEMK
jgi:hypothetical protein